MDVTIQLICFVVSFFYGIFVKKALSLNETIFRNKKLFKFISIPLLIYCLVLFYLLIIYKINGGIMHIYFLFVLILGFMSFHKIKKLLIKCLKKPLSLVKKKQK